MAYHSERQEGNYFKMMEEYLGTKKKEQRLTNKPKNIERARLKRESNRSTFKKEIE